MRTFIKNLAIGIFFVFALAAPLTVVATPQPALAGAACEGRLLGIPPWYRGLTDGDCNIKFENQEEKGALGNFIWKIVLNVVEMAIVITTYATAFFIIYGGFLFMTGGSVPGQVEKGRKTIINAVVGMIICLGAIALTNLLFGIIE